MKRLVLVVFLFTCYLLFYPVFAQQNKTLPTLHEIDSLKNVLKAQNDDSNKVNTLNRLSLKHEILGNYDTALPYAESAQSLAERINFKEGEADAFKIIGVIYFRQSNYKKALEYLFKSFTIYQDIGYREGMASAVLNIGVIDYTLGNYSKALEYYFKVLSITPEIKGQPTIAGVFCNIGIIYGEQGNYPKALEYLSKSLGMQIKNGNKDAIAVNLGDIGDTYLLQDNYPKALEYELKAVAQAQEIGDKEIIASSFGEMGTIYYKKGNYARSLDYDFKAVTIARTIGDIDEVAILYSNIGEVYINLKNYERAKNFLDSALDLSKKIGDKKNIKITYSNLATLDSATGNFKTAYYDYKKYTIYRDSIVNQGTTQMELSDEFERREDSIRAEFKQENIIKTDEINRKKILIDSTVVILVLTVLLALLLVNRQQIKRKKEKIIFEKEKQQIENELANAKAMLDDYVENMVKKNRLLEQFKIDIEELKEEMDEKRMESLKHLNKTTILTDEDWNKFKELFEEVYKGFFARLKEKLPVLTQAEVRLLCLTKLSLGTKQMADILGVSTNTILTSRYRLRKKLGLSEKDSLDDVADSI